MAFWSRSISRMIIVGLLSWVGLHAQTPVKQGTFEASVYVGETFDFPGASAFAVLSDPNAVGTTAIVDSFVLKYQEGRIAQPLVGGRIGVNLTRFLALYGDYAYNFLADRQTASVTAYGLQFTETAVRRYWMAGGGVELSLPAIHRISPFLTIGAGIVHDSYAFTDREYLAANPSINAFGTIYKTAKDLLAPTVGGGIRWFFTERSGLRIAVDGFYVNDGLPQEVPAAAFGGTTTLLSRRNGGRVTLGYFLRR